MKGPSSRGPLPWSGRNAKAPTVCPLWIESEGSDVALSCGRGTRRNKWEVRRRDVRERGHKRGPVAPHVARLLSFQVSCYTIR